MGLRGAALALGLMLVCLTLAASPAHAAPEDFIEACSNGIAVPDPEDNPGLVQDCAVLLSIRDTLAGDATLHWSSSTPILEWEGVELGDSPRVDRVDLASKGLTGSIPPEFALLPHLRFLSLWNNHLVGNIPEELTDLVNLRILYLKDNNLQGCIPLKLQEVGMSDLSRMANRFCPPSRSEAIEMCSHGHVDVPFFRSDLHVEDCAIVIRALFMLTGRSTEWSGFYGETTLAVSIGECCPRRIVGIYINGLDTWHAGVISAELGELDRLKRLTVTRQKVGGTIPSEIGDISGLEFLDLSENKLSSGIPEQIAMMPRLRNLNLSFNRLDGPIPRMFDKGALESIQLQGNQLTGEIPRSLGSLSGLERLWLHDNLLAGQVPKELGSLSSLESLRLGGNPLTGCLPPDLRAVSRHDFDRLDLPDCSEPDPGATGTGLAPTPPAALPIAVNTLAVLATVMAILGIAAGLRMRYRP